MTAWVLVTCGVPSWLRRNLATVVVVGLGAFLVGVLVWVLYQLVALTMGTP